jgi:hypothetical protein
MISPRSQLLDRPLLARREFLNRHEGIKRYLCPIVRLQRLWCDCVVPQVLFEGRITTR